MKLRQPTRSHDDLIDLPTGGESHDHFCRTAAQKFAFHPVPVRRDLTRSGIQQFPASPLRQFEGLSRRTQDLPAKTFGQSQTSGIDGVNQEK
jgi:hypothetical protein